MNNMIPFDQSAKLPAYLMAAGALSLNDAAEEFASVKFPSISTKGKVFHIKRDDTKTLILRPKNNPSDPDEPASYIEVAILNLQKSKTYYSEGYTEGSEAKPDCSSDDGITPNAASEAKQSPTCALCPHNAWGSGKNDKGEATKGKACSDAQRLAVASPSTIDDPMLLRVPPASLRNLAEMSKILSKKSIPLNGVVTRVSFDPSTTGVMEFKAIGFLDADSFTKAQAMQNDDLVLAIVGKSTRGTDVLNSVPDHLTTLPKKEEVKPAAKATEPEITDNASLIAAATAKAAADKKAKADAKAAKLAAAEAALKAVQSEDDDAEPVAETIATVATGSFDAELDALLS